jgi:competence protein ComK
LFIVNYYIINLQMVLMMGEYNRYGKLCTRILELDKTFLVDKAPLEVLKDTVHYLDLNQRGLSPAKHVVGDENMCSLEINPIQDICAFPNQAYKNEDTIWFNPIHIMHTSALGRHTLVGLSNGCTIEVHSRLSSFNQKWQKAQLLRRTTVERGKNQISLLVDQKEKVLFKKGPTGSYNFEIFLRK